jgi:hypothetical protein
MKTFSSTETTILSCGLGLVSGIVWFAIAYCIVLWLANTGYIEWKPPEPRNWFP